MDDMRGSNSQGKRSDMQDKRISFSLSMERCFDRLMTRLTAYDVSLSETLIQI